MDCLSSTVHILCKHTAHIFYIQNNADIKKDMNIQQVAFSLDGNKLQPRRVEFYSLPSTDFWCRTNNKENYDEKKYAFINIALVRCVAIKQVQE